MKPIAQAIAETRQAVNSIMLFNSIIDALLVLFICSLAAILFHVPWYYALIPFGIYTVVHTRSNLRLANLREVEEKAPELKEQLITVADNLRDTNDIIEELNADVLRKMREIKTASFLSFSRLMREICVMAVLAFVIIGMAANNVYFIDFKETFKELKELRELQNYAVDESQLGFEEGQNLSDILGDKSIAELGAQQLDLEINPILSDVDIGKVNDPVQREFKEVPPSVIEATTDASFEESIPKNYQRMVKTYFRQISQS
jgi:hypothetical protein